MKIFLIVDWKTTSNKFWLEEELEKLNFEVEKIGIQKYNILNRTIKWRKVILWLQYLKCAIITILRSNKNDIIISWNFIIGIFIGFINKLFHLQRRVISLNIILYKKNILHELIRRYIYNFVLNSKYFVNTVNAIELIPLYQQYHKIKFYNYYQLNDACDTTIEDITYNEGKRYVFSGGEAVRDWETLFNVALMDKNLQYQIVARKKYFNKKLIIPQNVHIHFDIKPNEFYELLKNSSIVILPLSSLATAGLTVILHAVSLAKPIIATSTPSTKKYILHRKTGILVNMGDPEQLYHEIIQLKNSKELCNKYVLEMKKHIEENFTKKKYADTIYNILKHLNWI